MPKWLIPWLLPLAMLAAIGLAGLLGSVDLGGSTVVWLILVLVAAGLLIRLRLQHLKRHLPDPELAHKPFWRF